MVDIIPDNLKPLSESDKKKQFAAMDSVSSSVVPKIIDFKENPNQYIYFIAFDGTANDRNNLKSGQQPTIPAVIEKDIKQAYEAETDPAKGAGRFESRYYSGVGTQSSSKLYNLWDSAFSVTDDKILKKAYEDFQHQAQQWIKENPDAQISVVVTGFSRGAAIARNFLNEIDDNGVPLDPSFKRRPSEGSADYEKNTAQFHIQPHDVRSAAILFDTVSTNMTYRNLEIPRSTDYVLHFVSDNEKRFITFQADSILEKSKDAADPRLVEIRVPGVHTDISNGYRTVTKNGTELMTLGTLNEELSREVLSRMGMDQAPYVNAPAMCRNVAMVEHDSRSWIQKIASEVPVINAIYSAIEPNNRAINYQEQNETQTAGDKARVEKLFTPERQMSTDPNEPQHPIFNKFSTSGSFSSTLNSATDNYTELLKDHGKTHGLETLSEQRASDLAKVIKEGTDSGLLRKEDFIVLSRDSREPNPVALVQSQQLEILFPDKSKVEIIPVSCMMLSSTGSINNSAFESSKSEISKDLNLSKLDVLSYLTGNTDLKTLQDQSKERESQRQTPLQSVLEDIQKLDKFNVVEFGAAQSKAPQAQAPAQRSMEMSRE